MAQEKTLHDVIERLKAEGLLTRNTGSNSIRTVKQVLNSTHEESANQMDDLKDAIMHSTETTLQTSKNIFDSIVNPTTENETPDTEGDTLEKEKEQTQLFKSLLDAQLENNKLTRDILFLQKGMKGGGSGSRFGFTRLGNIFGGSALTALLAPAAAMASIGAGVGGFFLGLKLSNLALDFFDSEPNYDGIKKAVVAFGDIFKDVDPATLTATLAVLGGGAIVGAMKGPKAAGGIAATMTAIGAGISGFFLGLATGDKALSWLNTDMAALKKAVIGVADVLSVVSTNKGFLATGALMATGGVLGALFGGSKKGSKRGLGATAGIVLIGAGIAGFLVEMQAVSALAEKFNTNGEGLKSLLQNLAAGLGAFDAQTGATLAGMLVAGGLFGQIPGAAGLGLKAGIGLSVIGAGIAAFIGSFDAVASVLSRFGVNGSSMRELLENLAGGLKPFGEIDGDNLLKNSTALAKFGVGMTPLFATDAWIKLTDEGEMRRFQKLFPDFIETLRQVENIDPTKFTAFGEGVAPLAEFANALEYLEDMDVDDIGDNLEELARKMEHIIPLLRAMYFGGKYTLPKFGFDAEFDFGPGLKNVPTEQIAAKLKPLALMIDLDTTRLDESMERVGQRNLEVPASPLTEAAQVAEETTPTPQPLEEVVVTAEREPPPRREDFLPAEPPPTFLPRVENPYEGLEVPTPKFEMEPLEAPELDIPDIQIEPPNMTERELGSMYLQDQQKQLASQTTNNQVASIAMMGGSTNISNNSNSQTTNLIGARPSSRNGSRASNWRVG